MMCPLPHARMVGLWNSGEPSNYAGLEDKGELVSGADGRLNDNTATTYRFYFCEMQFVCPAGHSCSGTSILLSTYLSPLSLLLSTQRSSCRVVRGGW